VALEAILGVSPPIFIGMTLILMGGAALLIGQAVAATWRPMSQAIGYAILLAVATRFLSLALFYGDPFFNASAWAYGVVIDAICHIAYAALAYRVTWVGKMVTQYPWLYERAGLFGYRRCGERSIDANEID